MSSDETQNRELVASWMAAAKAGESDAVLDLMTDDAVFLVPGRPPMRKSEFAAQGSGAGAPRRARGRRQQRNPGGHGRGRLGVPVEQVARGDDAARWISRGRACGAHVDCVAQGGRAVAVGAGCQSLRPSNCSGFTRRHQPMEPSISGKQLQGHSAVSPGDVSAEWFGLLGKRFLYGSTK